MENNFHRKPATLPQMLDVLTQHVDIQIREQYRSEVANIWQKHDLPPIETLTDIQKSLKYVDGQKLFKPQIHIGQRKLFLTELQFLTKFADTLPTIMIYAGAAPGIHMGMLARLFPHVRFLLVDPNPFDIRDAHDIKIIRGDTTRDANVLVREFAESDARIYIINGLFTHEIASACGNIIPKSLFVSDIRTNMHTDSPTDLDIIWNNAQMFNWVTAMKPSASMLKFRVPFSTEPEDLIQNASKSPFVEEFELAKRNGIDFMSDYASKTLMYMGGDVYVQAWAPVSSTESRLIVIDATSRKEYNWSEYEDKFYYFNNISRAFGHFENENADSAIGFDHCADCALENALWKEYTETIDDPLPIKTYVSDLSKSIKRPLHNKLHQGKSPIRSTNFIICEYKKVINAFTTTQKQGGNDVTSTKYAWVILLENEKSIKHAMVLVAAIQLTKTRYPIVILHNIDVDTAKLSNYQLVLNPIQGEFSRISILDPSVLQYDRVVVIDPTIHLIAENCDDLFNLNYNAQIFQPIEFTPTKFTFNTYKNKYGTIVTCDQIRVGLIRGFVGSMSLVVCSPNEIAMEHARNLMLKSPYGNSGCSSPLVSQMFANIACIMDTPIMELGASYTCAPTTQRAKMWLLGDVSSETRAAIFWRKIANVVDK